MRCHFYHRVIACAVTFIIESTLALSFLSQNHSLCKHSYHRVNACTVIFITESMLAQAFTSQSQRLRCHYISQSQYLRKHSYYRVNLCFLCPFLWLLFILLSQSLLCLSIFVAAIHITESISALFVHFCGCYSYN